MENLNYVAGEFGLKIEKSSWDDRLYVLINTNTGATLTSARNLSVMAFHLAEAIKHKDAIAA